MKLPGLIALLLAVPAGAAEAPPPAMTRHTHPGGGFSYEVPQNWTVGPVPEKPLIEEAKGDGQIVRFVYAAGDAGFDSLHVSCMLERLRPEQQTSPHIRYEYDFLSGDFGDYRILESAFELSYDEPYAGVIDWRQRNVTIVGRGHSLCMILHTPLKDWKKRKGLKALQEMVVRSVVLK
jgi:hypothetical protein